MTIETFGNMTNTNLNITTTSTNKIESTLNSTTTENKKETTGLPTQKSTKKITLTTKTTKGITNLTTTLDTKKTTKNSPPKEANTLKYIIIGVILAILVFCFCCCYCCWEDLKHLPFVSRLRKTKKLKIIRKQTFSDEDRDITFVCFKGEDFAIKEEPIIIKKQIKVK